MEGVVVNPHVFILIYWRNLSGNDEIYSVLVSTGSEATWLAERIVWGSGGLDIVRLE